MINLFTSFYLSDNIERQKELDYALNQNIKHQHIKLIILFLDDQKAYDYLTINFNLEKIKTRILNRMPLFSDFFTCINIFNNNDEIYMICNNDIWLFPFSSFSTFNFNQLHPIKILQNLKNNMMLTLTRHEYNFEPKLMNKYGPRVNGSHDAFIFRGTVPNEIIKNLKFPQNLWGSENALLNEFRVNNYCLYNPCFHIKIIHQHKEEERDNNRKHVNQLFEKYRNTFVPYIDKKVVNLNNLYKTNNVMYSLSLPVGVGPIKCNKIYPIKPINQLHQLF